MAAQKKSIRSIATIILLMIAGAAVGFLGAQFGMNAAKTQPGINVVVLLVLLIPVYFIVVGFHEGGHVVAGLLMGFEFRMFVVGPFLWEKENGLLKFKWNKNVNVSGGMAICLPTESENLSKRFSFYAAGGPIASILFSGITFLMYLAANNWTESGVTWLTIPNQALFMTSFLSLVIFVVTTLPFHAGGFYSDGARIIRFLRGGDVARFDLLLLKIIAGSASGIRPRDLQLSELIEAKALAQKLNAPMEVYLHAYHYQIDFDNNEIERAEEHLQNYVKLADNVPGGIRNAVWLDAAFFYAVAKQDHSKVEFFWSQFTPSALIPKAMVLATEAAMFWLKNDRQSFEEKYKASLQELPHMLDRGLSIALRDKLLLLNSSTPEIVSTHLSQPISQTV